MSAIESEPDRKAMLTVAILAGGLGTRIRDAAKGGPKALLDIGGRPFVEHQLELLRRNSIRHAVLCVGHLADHIEKFCGDGARFGMRLEYSYDGPALLGTAGAIRKALPKLSERFFVLYGDSYLTCDFAAVQAAFLHSGKEALMTVLRNEGRWDRSNVEFAGGEIRIYDKKQSSAAMQHIDYGLGVFKNSVFASLPENAVIDLADVYKSVLSAGQLAAFEVSERFYEVGSPAGLSEFKTYLNEKSHERRS